MVWPMQSVSKLCDTRFSLSLASQSFDLDPI